MENRIREGLRAFIEDESGQGISEYGALIAFIAILVGLVFGVASSPLAHSVSAAFSAMEFSMNNLASGAANASS